MTKSEIAEFNARAIQFDAESRERKREYQRRWYMKNRERSLEKNKQWRSENPEKVREYSRRATASGYEQSRKDSIYARGLVPSVLRQAISWKSSAKTRKKEWSLTPEYLTSLAESQPYCAITGLPFILERGNDFMVSLDRKDSSVGYVEGNVQLVLSIVNRSKNDLSSEDHVLMSYFVVMANKHLLPKHLAATVA
jgi:hypothetical protein